MDRKIMSKQQPLQSMNGSSRGNATEKTIQVSCVEFSNDRYGKINGYAVQQGGYMCQRRGHKRGHSDGIRGALLDNNSKENIPEKKQEKILEGGIKIRILEEKIKQLQKRMQSTQNYLLHYPSLSKKQAQPPADILQLISHVAKQKVAQINENMHHMTQQIHIIRAKLEENNHQHDPYLAKHHLSQEAAVLMSAEIEQKLGNLYVSLRKQFQAHFLSIQEKVKKLTPHKQYEQALNIEPQFFRTNRKYSGNPISFLYEEYIRQKQGSESQKPFSFSQPTEEGGEESKIRINQITYYIDDEGFLLDNEGLYLVNSKNMQIRLSERELRMLRKANILKN